MQVRTVPALVIWLLASIVAAISCSAYLSAARYQGEYLPVGNDSFYHARRILDAVQDPDNFHQFDPKIHAPEGSLLVWPWGYDWLMAKIARAGLALGLSADPMAILIWVPTAAVFLSMALLVLIGRRLSLPPWPLALAAACMAFATTTQFLHGTGQIDHHYAEMILVLGMIAAGLKWFAQPQDVRAGVVLGLVLGIAPGIHNGLFILQLPILAALLVHWLQGVRMPLRPASAFAATLVLTTLAVALPSLAFRTGLFEFYTLSWFHLYVAFCTAVICLLFARLTSSPRGIAIVVAACIALALPVLTQLNVARSFVTGSPQWLEAITEMKSPVREAFVPGAPRVITYIYSGLFWIAPVTLLLCLYRTWRERSSPRLLFWITAAGGLALLATQVRMHYFGDFALYLPWLVVLSDLAAQRPQWSRKIFLAASLALVLLYAPVLRHQLIAPVPLANDESYQDTRPVYLALRRACEQDPGIVLADNNAGHYIRYYTQCSVIANNFLLTPQHFAKMDRIEQLFSLSAAELVQQAPEVKYVLVRPLGIRRDRDAQRNYKYWFPFPGIPRLANDLLLGDTQQVPSEYEPLHFVRFTESNNIPFASLYKIHRPARPADPAPSSNDSSK